MICIGTVLRTRGIHGEVVISASPDIQISQGKESFPVVLKSSKYSHPREMEEIRIINGQILCKFKGIDSINDALRFIQYDLYVEEPLPKRIKRNASASLAGFEVLGPDGALLGIVAGESGTPLNPLLEIRIGASPEPVAIPFHPEIVRKIDKRKKRIWIDPPGGLLDLNR